LIGLILGIALLILTVWHWDKIDAAFVGFLDHIGGLGQ